MSKPNLLFPTPVWTVQLENYKSINELMYSYIKTLQKNDEVGINKSNVKGWHSQNFDLNNNENLRNDLSINAYKKSKDKYNHENNLIELFNWFQKLKNDNLS